MRRLLSFAASFLAVVAIFCPGTAAAQAVEPGGTPTATEMALKNSHEYAWQLFLYLNLPAVAGKAGVPDGTKKFGVTDTALVWESWALSSGDDFSETYPKDGARPVNWDALPRTGPRRLILETSKKREAFLETIRRQMPASLAKFVPLDASAQEVRANRSTYEFIIKNEMYHMGGLEALLDKARRTGNRQLISFDAGSKEIKAQWLPIAESQKSRYLWREAPDADGVKRVWGLVAFHVITKDLPNWFWSDFGHVDCEGRQNACAIDGQELAQTKPADRTTRGAGAPSGVNGIRNETKGTVFENYILRGTQVDFVTPEGGATILSNPVIENGFQNSSCMTCHARAAVGTRRLRADGKPSPFLNLLNPGVPVIGSPNGAVFGLGQEFNVEDIIYLQTDFIWSAPFRVKRQP